jgi:hypothetical protein
VTATVQGDLRDFNKELQRVYLTTYIRVEDVTADLKRIQSAFYKGPRLSHKDSVQYIKTTSMLRDHIEQLEAKSGRLRCEELLFAVDGVRCTWQSMLKPGASGRGIMPWVSELAWWDCEYTVSDLTNGAPTLTPAFISWRAPTAKEIFHWSLPYPFLIVTSASYVGYNDWAWAGAGCNLVSCGKDDCCDIGGSIFDAFDSDHGVAVRFQPLGQVPGTGRTPASQRKRREPRVRLLAFVRHRNGLRLRNR